MKPEVEWAGDGCILVTLFLPAEERVAEVAAMEIAKRMGLQEAEVIHKQVMHPAEGTLVEFKGRLDFAIELDKLEIPQQAELLSEEEIRKIIKQHGLTVVAATVGEDEHSVGMREIVDIKHGGIESFGVKCHYLGTSVPVQKVIDAAIETNSQAILISTIISHGDIHRINMKKLNDLCVEKGVRDRFIHGCRGNTG